MRTALLIFSLILVTACTKTTDQRFKAYYTASAPVIDGHTNDTIWSAIPEWYTDTYIWLNNVDSAPKASDFSWRYKLAWNESKFFVLVEITDDMLHDFHAKPKENYWEDDCFEVLFDEDNSGGGHQASYQAFIYHISKYYDAVDIDAKGDVVVLNNHVSVKRSKTNGRYTWEAAFDVYDKNYESTTVSTPVKLTKGKVMGWAMAYCDNDGRASRDHFFGTNPIKGDDKNQTWKTADAFGEVVLVE